MHKVEVRSFIIVFGVSIIMIHMDIISARLIKLIWRDTLDSLDFIANIVQFLSFIFGGAIIARVQGKRSEWHMFLSFVVVGAIYLAYFLAAVGGSCHINDYKTLAIFAKAFFNLIVGLFVATASNWLVKKRYLN